jgi:hypothetical protein
MMPYQKENLGKSAYYSAVGRYDGDKCIETGLMIISRNDRREQTYYVRPCHDEDVRLGFIKPNI